MQLMSFGSSAAAWQVAERQADGPGAEGADAQEVAARQAVAEPNALVAFKSQHG